MIDIQLDPVTWDLSFEASDLLLVEAEDETVQHIKQRLLTFEAEWFLDLSVGLPWIQEILEKPQDINTVEVLLKECIQSSPGVDSIISFGITEVPQQERSIQVDFMVLLSGGTATNNISVELGI